MHSTPIGPQTTNHIFALVCAAPHSVYYNTTKRSKTAHDDSVVNSKPDLGRTKGHILITVTQI